MSHDVTDMSLDVVAEFGSMGSGAAYSGADVAEFIVLRALAGPVPLAARGLTAMLARAGPASARESLAVVGSESSRGALFPDDDRSIRAGGGEQGAAMGTATNAPTRAGVAGQRAVAATGPERSATAPTFAELNRHSIGKRTALSLAR